MPSAKTCVLTVNGGSSSIKFALFDVSTSLQRTVSGKLDGIGQERGRFSVSRINENNNIEQTIAAPDYATAITLLMDWIDKHLDQVSLVAVGHRIVHGGPTYWKPALITPEMLEELQRLSPFDPEHLPEEILLSQKFQQQFPDVAQIACFDTAFHHELPVVAQLLSLPRRYWKKGLRRYGFHGLSCEFLLQKLTRIAGSQASQGRVILAHLGNGASVTAVRNGNSMDTSMGFTPTSGLPMSSRSGDLDPGLIGYLACTEGMSPRDFQHMINNDSGLLGVSEISGDIRELLQCEKINQAAADAVALFCYQTKKWICALAGALEGLDTLIFTGGIGQNIAEIRNRICTGLEFIGIALDAGQNQANAAIISLPASRVVVRVIATDEELMIAQNVCRVLDLKAS